MLGSHTRSINVIMVCLRSSRQSRATGEPGRGMPTKAHYQEQMLFYRLDSEVIDLPHMADACNESDNLAERDSSPVTAVPDHCGEGGAVLGVRTERNLN